MQPSGRQRVISPKKPGGVDWVGPVCIVGLLIFGGFFLYSAQVYSGTVNWIKHAVGLGVAAGVYLLTARTDYKKMLHHGHWVYGLSMILLALVLTPLGREVYGCKRWLDLKVVHLQPAELAKIGTLIITCSLLARSRLEVFGNSTGALLKLLGIVGLPMGLVFLQPDLGSALVFPPMILALLYATGVSKRFFMLVIALGVLLLGLVFWDIKAYEIALREKTPARTFLPLKDYQRNRILAFVAPEVVDPKGVHMGWNRRQSLISIGSGGLWGKGWLQGTQAKLGYLPKSIAHNDFIFSVLAEERGFLGGTIVLVLYSILLFNTLRIASMARDRFGFLLAVGISVLFMVHILVNIGMTLGLMPITGIPLPFLSHGLTFLLSCCFLQGIIQSIYRFRRTQSSG